MNFPLPQELKMVYFCLYDVTSHRTGILMSHAKDHVD